LETNAGAGNRKGKRKSSHMGSDPQKTRQEWTRTMSVAKGKARQVQKRPFGKVNFLAKKMVLWERDVEEKKAQRTITLRCFQGDKRTIPTDKRGCRRGGF